MSRLAVAIAVAGLCVILFLAGSNILLTTRGAMVTGFGESTGRSEEKEEFYLSARSALGSWLEGKGFKACDPPIAEPVWAGVHHAEGKEVWYRGKHNGSREFHVLVRYPTTNASGLDAYVWWHIRSWRWRADEDKARIEAFVGVLSKWWEEYRAGRAGVESGSK